jgi:hypothetical protein
MSFNIEELDAEKATQNKLSRYDDLIRSASNINSQAASLKSNFDALRADLTLAQQATLDSKMTQFALRLRTTLGL